MNRFLVFAYNEYYPFGGMEDCVFKSEDYATALKKAQEYADDTDILEQLEYVKIYDITQDKMVYEFVRPSIDYSGLTFKTHYGVDYSKHDYPE